MADLFALESMVNLFTMMWSNEAMVNAIAMETKVNLLVIGATVDSLAMAATFNSFEWQAQSISS